VDITFINTFDFAGIEKPIPASESIPDWYKETQSYMNGAKVPDGQGGTTGTIKRCMPVFDAIAAGYLLTLPADIYVSIIDGRQVFQWPQFDLIAFHPIEQASGHPDGNGLPYPKFMNPWGVLTPDGYSILLIQPMHRDLPFNVLPGIVDTDKYPAPVNVIFSMKDPTFEGTIPKGTPFAQIIPFKREAWKMVDGGEKELKLLRETKLTLRTKFFDAYKNMFRSKKEFK
jgi:hypothetical protein